MHAKFYAPPKDTIFMDSMTLAIHPGDPASEEYEEHLFDCTDNFMMTVRTVVKPPVVLDDGTTCSFDMEVFEYVRDGSKSFIVL
jgi:hypothetical protein